MNVFGKLITAMVTPFDENLEVNHRATSELVRFLIEEQKTDAILVSGTTGESPTLSSKEKLELVKTVKKAAQGQAQIIVGCGSNNTRESIVFSQEVCKLQVDGIMLVAPYYNKPPIDGMYTHFSMVAYQIDCPILLYNVPGRTASDMSYELIEKLAAIPNIKALKEASSNLDKVAMIKKNIDQQMAIYSGNDNMTLPILALGGVGVVSVASHFIGQEIKDMLSAWENGDAKEALDIHLKLLPLFQSVFLTTNPIPVKETLNILGLEVGGLRPPLKDMSGEDRTKLLKILKEAKLV